MWPEGNSPVIMRLRLEEMVRLIKLRIEQLDGSTDIEKFKLQRLLLHLNYSIKICEEMQ